jgi:hypothetical protein
MIHSIQTAPEETILVRSVSGIKAGQVWDDGSIPQQLHISRLPSGSLSLGPGQVAIVPLTFLPRYPSVKNNFHDGAGIKTSPKLSSVALADLGDIVGDGAMDQLYNKLLGSSTAPTNRNNLDQSLLPQGDEYEVSTTLLVETTKGVMKIPVSASSFRENLYAAPDNIRFHHPEAETYFRAIDEIELSLASMLDKSATPASISEDAILLDTINFDDGNAGEILSKPFEVERDCYDLFLSNLSPTSELEISEVMISRPELMSVEFDPSRLLLPPDLLILPTGPSQVIHQWTEEGPMYLPPDSVDNYVATVCTASRGGVERDENAEAYLEEMENWIDSGSPDRNLGFLQVRTNEETLFIGLERMEKAKVSTLLSGEQASPPLQSSTLLKATENHLDFHLIPSSNPAVVSSIGLENKSPAPIRIMRVSVGLDPGQSQRLLESLGLDISARLNIDDSSILEVGASILEALSITCSLNSDHTLTDLPKEATPFEGRIVIRGSMDTDISYSGWSEEIVKNPYHDNHLVLEIPYSISVLYGRVDVRFEATTHPWSQNYSTQPWDKSGQIISALFFPLSQLKPNGQDVSESGSLTQLYATAKEMEHALRVTSNIALPLSLEGAEIVGENSETFASMCQRFNITIFDTNENDDDDDMQKLGLISLHYKFGGKQVGERRRMNADREDGVPFHPATCYLSLITSPIDTGMHRIPLIIYSGHLEVSTPNSVPGNSPHSNDAKKKPGKKVETGNDPKATTMSFLRTLSWVRSSAVGKSLLIFLESIADDKLSKGFRTESNLLLNYLRKVCSQVPKIDRSKLKPILLKIGAIEHSKISRTPLFITNHNPVPVTVTIDVREVEGMSISLGRDASQGRGDGDSILDYLPKLSTLIQRKEHLVDVVGDYIGHPLGGLRQFLLSNDNALSFISQFPFRDAVSMNKAAVVRQPILSSLYDFHSYVKFHSEQFPGRSSSLSRRCKSPAHPPLYKSFETKDDIISSGPLILSDNRNLTRFLKVCWEQEDSSDTSYVKGSSVVIPPGGTARFMVRVRAPPQTYLNSDISQLLATGLVLSTSFGNVMPIFATFEALQGQLHVSHIGPSSLEDNNVKEAVATSSEDEDVTIIGVPLGLYWKPSHTDSDGNVYPAFLSIPPAPVKFSQRRKPEILGNATLSNDGGVSLHLSSTFSREVRLLQVESCNPWFSFVLRDSGMGYNNSLDTGTNIGLLYSTVSCAADNDSDPAYPSYYQCALNWLTHRSELQPPGCGLLPLSHKRKPEDDGGVDASHRGVRRVRRAFEEVLSILGEIYASDTSKSFDNVTSLGTTFSYSRGLTAIKSGRKRSDGVVSLPILDIFAEAWDAWRVASDFGLGVLSSNLRAKIEYDTFSEVENAQIDPVGQHSLSLSMHNLAVESMLVAPKLIKPKRTSGESKPTNLTVDSPSIVEFPSTFVGTLTSATIPLQNPTPIPVRVRLSTSPSVKDSAEGSLDSNIRNRFLQNLGSPYVQNGVLNPAAFISPHHHWWDSGGSFYMADSRGDIIRSSHNITIRAGKGSHVSLVNPSLHANNAFVVGCGVRCGMRENTNNDEGPELSSTIGAAAAAGITLMGRKRFPLSQMNTMAMDEPNVLAGGVAGSGGPSAFAVPYSALDEIVIPPYGVVEVGPIYFRPPGRFGILGCDLALESKANFFGAQSSKLCKEQVFETILFIENSLTGLERVVLRGKSLWERLYFVDPPPVVGEDAFGDIESRDGRPTLVFEGSAQGNKIRKSMIKEVLLHNGGDVALEIAVVYFADNNRVMEKRWPSRGVSSEACIFGSFRLLNCYESSQMQFVDDDGNFVENIHTGFKLLPGRNQSLFIEHMAVCTKQNEFISLNIEYTRQGSPFSSDTTQDDDILSVSRSGETRNLKARKANKALRKKIDLGVGYQMTTAEFADCAPVDHFINEATVLKDPNSLKNEISLSKYHVYRFRGDTGVHVKKWYTGVFWWISKVLVLLSSFGLLAYSSHVMTQEAKGVTPRLNIFAALAKKISKKTKAPKFPRWYPMFRCLARADPSSAELQTLGREQIRQVIINRYRGKGKAPPQSLNHPVFFLRDRVGSVPNSSSRQRSGKEVVTGNERTRTLSDALFKNFSIYEKDSCRDLLPVGLGWRTAISRGVIDESSIEASTLKLRTRSLNRRRKRAEEAHFSSGGSSVEEKFESHDVRDEDFEDYFSSSDEYISEDEEYLENDFYDEVSEDYLSEKSDHINSDSTDSDFDDYISENITFEGDLYENQSEQKEYESLRQKDLKKISKLKKVEPKEHIEVRQRSNKLKKLSKDSKPKEAIQLKSCADKNPNPKEKGEKSKQKKEMVSSTCEDKTVGKSISKKKISKTKTSDSETKDSSFKPLTAEGKKASTKASQSSHKTTNNVLSKTTAQEGRSANSKKNNQTLSNPESKTTGKRNGHKMDPNDVSKTSVPKIFSGKQVGKKREESSQITQCRENGSSQNQKNRGPRTVAESAKGISETATNTRKEKGTKSERGKAKTSSETMSKKKGKNKSRKNQSQAQLESTHTASFQQADKPPIVEPTNAEQSSPRAGLRPPPGLALPPGFPIEEVLGGLHAGSEATMHSPMTPPAVPLNSNLTLSGSSPSTAFPFSQQHSPGESDLLYSSAAPESDLDFPLQASPTMAGFGQSFEGPIDARLNPPHESQNDGFDIMDFLDGILNDAGAQDQEPTQSTDPSIRLPENPPILPNPWATEGRSRAAAYGIAFENAGWEVNDQEEADSPILNVRGDAVSVEEQTTGNIPLLTPAAILFSGQDDTIGEDEEDMIQW